MATLEAVGSFEHVGDDGVLEALTGAGCSGAPPRYRRYLPELIRLRCLGHVVADGRCARMSGYRPAPTAASDDRPVVLIVGTYVVCSLATSTAAGVDLVKALSGLPALDVLDLASRDELRAILSAALGRGRQAVARP